VLNDRLVVVTGAGRGLGLAIARGAGRAGARLVVAERDPDLAANATRALAEEGFTVHRVDTDVSDAESVAALAEALEPLGPVHGLVNNAALADGVGGKPFFDIDSADFDRVMSVNVRGTWLVSKAVWPLLASDAAIVNLSSDAAFYGSPRLAHYITSKSAVIGLTRAMARDAGPSGITVNAVAPGLTVGEAADRIPAERHELYARNRALTRQQEPGDITGAVVFLLSGAASYITGQTLVVDGGFVFH
jgi:NAD(P)-dependent dehydrogenase (short-subunit alcohol dehydrogenase family)